MKQQEIIIGYTEDNRPVFCGKKVFQARDTHGLPLDVVIDELINKKKMAIDWVGYVEESIKSDWTWKKTISDLEYALLDARIDKYYADQILLRIKLHITKKYINEPQIL